MTVSILSRSSRLPGACYFSTAQHWAGTMGPLNTELPESSPLHMMSFRDMRYTLFSISQIECYFFHLRL